MGNIDRQALAMKYMELLQSGVPAAEAFKQVYPNGIPTAAQQQKADAEAKQGSALASTGGAVAGLLGVKYGMDYLDKGSKAAETVAAGASGATNAANTAASAGELMGPPVPSIANGGLAGPPPPPVEGLGVTPYLGAAGAALGAYGIKNAIDSGNTGQGALSGAGMGMGLGAAAPLFGMAGPAGWAGYAGLAALGALGGGALTKALYHESTRDTAKRHTKELLGASKDPNYQSYVSGMREQYNSAPPDPTKPFAGKYASFEEYKKAGLDPKDLTGVYGNIKTFGTDWTNLSQAQREQVTQGLIGANLYDSKKGEVVITDPEKAKQVYSTIIKQTAAPAVSAASNAYQKKTMAQTGQFGNQLLQAINK